jgi:hypothetical protein
MAPLIYLAALGLLLEDWLWRVGAAMLAPLTRLPPLAALEAWLRRLPPYGALAAFVLPALLLAPVKLIALFAVARGHVWSGIAVIACAKLGGAAAVARIYALTLPALLTLSWFARWRLAFMGMKLRWVARLKTSAAWHQLRLMRRLLGRWWARFS